MDVSGGVGTGRIVSDTVRAFRGDPNAKLSNARELRFGTKGSLKADVAGPREGTWHDFETGEHGGYLDFVIRERGGDRTSARAWLVGQGILEGDAGNYQPRQRSAVAKPTATTPAPAPSKTQHLVAPILAGTIDADGTPGHRYLTARHVWPPSGDGPLLPSTVQWISSSAAGRVGPRLPGSAAGALVFVWQQPGEPQRQPGEPQHEPCAVSLMAIDGDAQRVPWGGGEECKTCGGRSGAMFVARHGARGEPLHVAEGECDALAVALMEPTGTVAAMGGTGGMQGENGMQAVQAVAAGGGGVVIHADGDVAGNSAATALGGYLRRHDIRRQIKRYAPDEDPASALDGWIGERSAIREFDGEMAREEADIAAWDEYLTHCKKRGNDDD